ncbi:MAG: stage 0 sporulation family protein [Desulfurivibrionaceae bacterium]
MQDNAPNDTEKLDDAGGDPGAQDNKPAPLLDNFYYVRFRTNLPAVSATSRIADLERNESVMIQTDHGLEPARVTGIGPQLDIPGNEAAQKASYLIVRRANRDEQPKIERLMERETEAFAICRKHIEKHRLAMKLTRVERLFNGSKIIFYFTAENRVDFRELVKDLVQEFRTRVEIRQIGVRHETKMVGGLGGCGRELCCSSFLQDFAPVSIKMAKEQNLPLNPAKISGVCNRLLCCLTYEYKTYHKLRKGMPRPGKTFSSDGVDYKVMQSNILKEEVTIMPLGNPDQKQVITKEEWLAMKGAEPAREQNQNRPTPPKKQKNKGRQYKSRKAPAGTGRESRRGPRQPTGESQEE